MVPLLAQMRLTSRLTTPVYQTILKMSMTKTTTLHPHGASRDEPIHPEEIENNISK